MFYKMTLLPLLQISGRDKKSPIYAKDFGANIDMTLSNTFH